MAETPSEESVRATAALSKKRALLHGVEAEIFKLVSAGATAEQWTEWLRVPLEHAAAAGSHDLFKRLVDAGADCGAGWTGCGGRTLLDAAAFGGNAGVVSALLHKGSRADVNAITTLSQRSALYTAVKGGHEAAARKLILAGADVNYEDPTDELAPLVVAVVAGYGAVATDLLLAGASPGDWVDAVHDYNLLQIAADRGDTEVVSALLSTNLDINVADEYGKCTPLMLATRGGYLPTVEILLTTGADVSLRNVANKAALDLAAECGHTEVMQAILGHGVDVNVRCCSGYTALHNAVRANEFGAVDVLLDAGADPNTKTGSGKTPLHYSAERGESTAVLALLRRGGGVNAVDHDGNTVLHFACRFHESGLGDVVDLLLRWGASVAAVNNASQTPLQVIDDYLDSIKTSINEWEMSRAAVLEPARSLLIRAPAYRAWRRRCLLVMLRSRNDNLLSLKEKGDRIDAERGGGGRRSTHDEIGVAGENEVKRESGPVDGLPETIFAEERLRWLVGVVVELMPDAVFHKIALFL